MDYTRSPWRDMAIELLHGHTQQRLLHRQFSQIQRQTQCGYTRTPTT